MDQVTINTIEEFEHLPNAPIVESVIDIRSQVKEPFEEGTLRAIVEPQLTGYHYLDSPRAFLQEFRMEGGAPPEHSFQDLGLKGVRFQSDDEKQIVQFNRDGFVFSRLKPYCNWTSFVSEGLQLWQIYRELAHPENINRVGLRVINRIQLPLDEGHFEDYIQPAPTSPRDMNLPFIGYMHQDTMAVPGHNYAISIIRTIQPPQPEKALGAGLILDIDVFTLQGFDLCEEHVVQCLEEMRWLKNKVFFGSVTPKAVESFR